MQPSNLLYSCLSSCPKHNVPALSHPPLPLRFPKIRLDPTLYHRDHIFQINSKHRFNTFILNCVTVPVPKKDPVHRPPHKLLVPFFDCGTAHEEVARNKTTENELNTTLEGLLATSDHYKKHKRVKPFRPLVPTTPISKKTERVSNTATRHVIEDHSLGNYRLITFGRTLGLQLPNTDYNRPSTTLLTTLLVYSPPHER
ncbi:uncharacterized protein Bfra_007668 [Botrytis fragariae]|uniref:Uncharacterized protein n=1 Tax=Botrytis fragariae TaxID=1964551 RepID=A0A8H6EG73_9HELO|nr:uncharacterized protein Bfra_007668 [Botrytis fragariae]KAF5871154.1 hypothetical protein Bfra_007668 [Botrytis fragariae]